MSAESATLTGEQNIYQQSSVKLLPLGSELKYSDGRIFRYAQAGAVALVSGKLTQSAVFNTDVENVNVASTLAVSDSATSVVIDAGGAIVAGVYEDGSLIVNDATGEGQYNKVKTNTVTSGAAELTITLYKPITQAITVDASQATLLHNAYKLVILSPTTKTAMSAGVPVIDVSINYYFWLQVQGPAAVLTQGTPAAGLNVTGSNGTAGAVELVNTTDIAQPVVGNMMSTGVDGEYNPVYLRLA